MIFLKDDFLFSTIDFTEIMRTLGFPRLISMENFRNPNFPLVAEILIWLVKRFEPNTTIPLEFETEQQRVFLIRTAAQFMATKAHIRLNTKRLYQADGYAVKELIKVASVLYDAFDTSSALENTAEEDDSSNYIPIDISAKIEDIKRARQLASEITTKGATLYDLLGKEVELREQRSLGLARPVELGKAEQAMRSAIDEAKRELDQTRQDIEGITASEASLDSKIEKKNVATRKMLETMQQEEGSLKFLEGSSLEGTSLLDNVDRDGRSTPPLPGDAPVNTAAAGVAAGRRVFGSMMGGPEDEDDTASLLGSDSDLLLGAGQDSELGTDDDDDDDLPIGDKMTINASTSGIKPQELSDDDF
ncbi:hypothetical protein B566_EDAN017184 [Ephemera danica]|nr:hypothetical protein B566_EDAN017184 [Ephemera danica]